MSEINSLAKKKTTAERLSELHNQLPSKDHWISLFDLLKQVISTSIMTINTTSQSISIGFRNNKSKILERKMEEFGYSKITDLLDVLSGLVMWKHFHDNHLQGEEDEINLPEDFIKQFRSHSVYSVIEYESNRLLPKIEEVRYRELGTKNSDLRVFQIQIVGFDGVEMSIHNFELHYDEIIHLINTLQDVVEGQENE